MQPQVFVSLRIMFVVVTIDGVKVDRGCDEGIERGTIPWDSRSG